MASFADDAPADRSDAGTAYEWANHARGAARTVTRPRYLAAGAAALPLVAAAFARFGTGAEFAVAAFVIASLCVVSAIDIAERRIPNWIVLPSFAIVLVAQTALFPDRALEWVVAAVGAALLLLVPLLVYPSSVGMGDVKLALLVGAALGSAVVSALLLASLAAAAYAVGLLVRHGADARHATMPFGPFLAFGAIVAILF